MLKSGPMPRYYQLKEIIRQKISSGLWTPGAPIPSERELCEQYGISRMTARQSITELVNEGHLYREQGKGTFVSLPKITQQLTQLTSYTEDMEARAKRPAAQVLSQQMVPVAAEEAAILRVKTGQLLFEVKRLRLANGEPLAIETALISFFGCEKLMEEDLENNSLYQLLEQKYGQPPLAADQELEARLAGEEVAGLLKINKGDPVLYTSRITYTDRNQPLEYASSVYRGDKYRFYTRLNRK